MVGVFYSVVTNRCYPNLYSVHIISIYLVCVMYRGGELSVRLVAMSKRADQRDEAVGPVSPFQPAPTCGTQNAMLGIRVGWYYVLREKKGLGVLCIQYLPH